MLFECVMCHVVHVDHYIVFVCVCVCVLCVFVCVCIMCVLCVFVDYLYVLTLSIQTTWPPC